MRSPAAERSLRRLVARLAAAEPDDVQQVLDALEPAQQAEVRALLEAYVASPAPDIGPAPSPAPAPEPAPVADVSHLAGLSPWLAGRVAAADGVDVGEAGRMTPGARAALAQAARSLPPEPTFALEAATPRRRGLNLFRRPGTTSWA